MPFEAAERVLNAAVEYGGIFGTIEYNLGKSTALSPMGKSSEGKSPPQLFDPGNSAYGIAEALEQKWIMPIPANGYVYDELLQMSKPGTVALNLVTIAGRQRITTDKTVLMKEAEQAALELLNAVGGDQFSLLAGMGFVEVSNNGNGFPREKLGIGLAFCLFQGWVKVSGNKFVVSDEGQKLAKESQKKKE